MGLVRLTIRFFLTNQGVGSISVILRTSGNLVNDKIVLYKQLGSNFYMNLTVTSNDSQLAHLTSYQSYRNS